VNCPKSTAVKVAFASMKIRVVGFVAVFTLLAMGMIAVFTPAALAATSCPSGGPPAPGSTVDGGLDVDGVCVVDDVTVNGGITVESGGRLQLTRSTVNGGILALPCGELDVNATLGIGAPTNTTSIIHGGIDIEAGIVCPPTVSLMPTSGRRRSTVGSR